MAKSIANIILLGIILPWLFIVVVAPYSAYLILFSLKEYLGSRVQIVGYISAFVVFIVFLLFWYKITMKYVQKMIESYSDVIGKATHIGAGAET